MTCTSDAEADGDRADWQWYVTGVTSCMCAFLAWATASCIQTAVDVSGLHDFNPWELRVRFQVSTSFQLGE